MPPTLTDLEEMARQAGEILRAGFGNEQRIYYKGEIDLVTDVDRRSEAFLLAEIQRRFPHDRIIAEESGGVSGQECCCWYIDPLDGTVNYAHGVPFFCVSIAYAEGDEARLGVVYDPIRDELYSAQRGRGAWLNGERVQASTARNLDESLLVTGFPYDVRTNPKNNLEQYALFALRSQGVRRLGSAALDLCYVAAGRLDGYWEISIEPWDLAAGTLIASEGGATVTDVAGGPDYLSPPCSVLAAAPAVHPAMLRLLTSPGN